MMVARTSEPSPAGAGGRDRSAWLWPALIVAAVVAVYANSLHGPFVFDDLASIPENPTIRRLWPITAVLQTPLGGQSVAGRPVVNLTLAINYAMGGLDVRGYHAWNIATHIACALLLFGVVRRGLVLAGFADSVNALSGRAARGGTPVLAAVGGAVVAADAHVAVDAIAGATALLWAVHPLQSEAVSYIVARTESTMAVCYLLTVYAALRATTGSRRLSWAVLSVTACAAGMASKESMAVAPVMVACLDRALLFTSWREAWRQRWRLYCGLAATWLVLAGLAWASPRAHSAGFVDGLGPGYETGAWTWLLNQAVMIARYLRLTAWPVGLVFDYGYPQPYRFIDVWLPFSALVLAVVLAIGLFVRRPRLGILPLWFFLSLAPSSSLIPIVTEVGAERRMYVPSMALMLAAVVGGWLLLRPLAPATRPGGRVRRADGGGRPWVFAAALLAIVVTLAAIGTRGRNDEYASPARLWQTVVERWPGGRAHANLAAMLYAEGRRDEALAHLRLAVTDLPDARYDLGAQLLNRREYDDAIRELQAFLDARPGHPRTAAARDLLGQALMRRQRLDEAVAQFRAITRLDPTYADAFGRLGDVLSMQERFQDAVAPLQTYAALTNTANAWRNLGVALARAGHADDAVQAFSREVGLAPQDPDARRNLANALLEIKAYAEAERQAREGVRLKPADPVTHDILGLALAGLGRLDEARQQFTEALRIDAASQDARAHLEALGK